MQKNEEVLVIDLEHYLIRSISTHHLEYYQLVTAYNL